MKITKNLMEQDSLLKELGLTEFDAKQQDELFQLLMDILEIKVMDAVLSELNEQEKKEFTVILLGENVDSAKEFLNKRIKNLNKKLDDVVKNFKAELLQDISEAKKQLLKK